jgi:hypothetical protein
VGVTRHVFAFFEKVDTCYGLFEDHTAYAAVAAGAAGAFWEYNNVIGSLSQLQVLSAGAFWVWHGVLLVWHGVLFAFLGKGWHMPPSPHCVLLLPLLLQ